MTTATLAAPSAGIAVHSTSIRQIDGLYSLNDLHRASGGAKRHQPSDFIRLEQSQALIAELENSGESRNFISLRVVPGRNGGTYACRELVIAYAAWISAAFHLAVIRVFLDAQAPQSNPTVPVPLDALRDCRWLMTFDSEGRPSMEPISDDKRLLSFEDIAVFVGSPVFPADLLPEVASHLMTRMFAMAGCMPRQRSKEDELLHQLMLGISSRVGGVEGERRAG